MVLNGENRRTPGTQNRISRETSNTIMIAIRNATRTPNTEGTLSCSP